MHYHQPLLCLKSNTKSLNFLILFRYRQRFHFAVNKLPNNANRKHEIHTQADFVLLAGYHIVLRTLLDFKLLVSSRARGQRRSFLPCTLTLLRTNVKSPQQPTLKFPNTIITTRTTVLHRNPINDPLFLDVL